MAKVTTVVPNASQRPSAMARSPRASSAAPPRIGSQIRTLRMGQVSCMTDCYRFLLLESVDQRSTYQASSTDKPIIIANA